MFFPLTLQVRIVDIEKELIYDTDVLVMGTDGLWDVTSNERVAEVVARSLEQFPAEDAARYKYRFTSAAQDLVMSSRGKLGERSWRTSDDKQATIDDISVFVIPLSGYKEDYLQWKKEQEVSLKPNPAIEDPVTDTGAASSTTSSDYISFTQSEQFLPTQAVKELELSNEESQVAEQDDTATKSADVISAQAPALEQVPGVENILHDDLTSSA